MSVVAKSRNLGGHTSKVKLHFTKKDGSTVYLQSSYEVQFASILERLDLKWSRPEPLNWIDDCGIEHKYYPDFELNGIYVDTKNPYLMKKDKRKIELVSAQNSIRLEVIGKENITEEYILALVAQSGRATAL